MAKKSKMLVLVEFPAPYRVAVVNELYTCFDADVFFCRNDNEERSSQYYVKDAAFPIVFLTDQTVKREYQKCLRHIRRYDFVFIFNIGNREGAMLALWCRIAGVPYSVNNDGAFIQAGSKLKHWVKRSLFKGATLCLASGALSGAYYKSYGVDERKIRYHHFTSLTERDILSEPLTQEDKQAIRRDLRLKPDVTYLITVGQFIYRKGFDLLLNVWDNFKDNTDVCLLIIGGGGKRAEYERMISEKDMKNVVILDFLPKAELFTYYKASDICVFPTREDIWGLVINEAMACGLPVVSSDQCVAALEWIEHGENGFLYPVENLERMETYLRDLINDAALRQKITANNIRKIQGNTMDAIGKQNVADIEVCLEDIKKG